MGVNALRTAHNPPAPELIAVCEQLGIVMMVEAFGLLAHREAALRLNLYFDQWSDSDIKEMVHAAKNSRRRLVVNRQRDPGHGSSRGPGSRSSWSPTSSRSTPAGQVVNGSDKYRSVPATGSPRT